VFILKGLIGPICTKIVQGRQVLWTKGLGRLAYARKQKSRQGYRRYARNLQDYLFTIVRVEILFVKRAEQRQLQSRHGSIWVVQRGHDESCPYMGSN
jgi:hypothetical protein